MIWRPLLALPARHLAPLLLVLLAVVTSAVNHFAQVQRFGREIEAQQRQRLLERLSLEQTRLEQQIGLDDAGETRRLIAALGLVDGITHAWLIGRDGRVDGALSRLDLARPAAKLLARQPAPLRQALLDALPRKVSHIRIERIAGEEALLGLVPIHDEHRLLVRLDLAGPLAARLHEGRGELLRQAGMTLAFAALLALLLHLLWFRRAHRLTDTTAAIASGHLEARAALSGHDELAEIGAAIDHMAGELQNRHAQLQQLASMIEHSPVVAIAWRNAAGWPVTFVSHNVRQWGYSRHDLLDGRLRFADLIHPHDRPYVESEVARHIGEGPDDYRLEYRLRHADGHWMWIDDRTWLSRERDGRVREIKGVLLDISEGRKAEEALRTQQEFFRLIAENIEDFIAVLDAEGRRLYNSPSYRRFFAEGRIGHGSDSFAEIHPEDRDRIVRIFRDTVRTGRGCRAEFRFLLDDGSVREMESSGIAIRDRAGQVTRVLVVSRDVTERKAAERAIHELNASLEARVAERTAELQVLNQSLESFVYSVSHDLKTPLRGIEGYSRLLQADCAERLDEEGRLFLANIRSGVARMNELIDDLLDYSRMERRKLDEVPVSLAAAVGRLLEERAQELARRGVRIESAVPPLWVRADADGLALVLRNLLENAVKFSAHVAQPRIDIGAREEGEEIVLWVGDNGIGFDMKYHDRIFEIFQRLHRLEDYPGTGIGLALVRKAMQRMGGRVWAEGAPGQGATFYLSFTRGEPDKLAAAT
ncbi:MAG: PAS domain-containing protein [Pseudomonadota bacterium]